MHEPDKYGAGTFGYAAPRVNKWIKTKMRKSLANDAFPGHC